MAKKAAEAKDAAETEVRLAKAEQEKITGSIAEAKNAVDVAEAVRKKADDALQA